MFDFLGQTESASTVFLSAGPGDNKLNLSWNFNVPWLNIQYDIYKETPTNMMKHVPKDYGAKKIGHFGVFSRKYRDSFWKKIAEEIGEIKNKK